VFSPHLNFSELTLLHAAAAPAIVWAGSGPAERNVAGTIPVHADTVILGLLLTSLAISAATIGSRPLADLWLVAAYCLALGLVMLPLRRLQGA
jgi:hypothetical protein